MCRKAGLCEDARGQHEVQRDVCLVIAPSGSRIFGKAAVKGAKRQMD